MLYYLKYVNHEIEKLQSLLDFFFNKVDVENPSEFRSNLLFPQWYQNTNHRLLELEKLLTIFLTFDRELKLKIINAFREANEIDILFSDVSKSIPIAKDFESYEWNYVKHSKEIKSNIAQYLNDLFVKLYSTQLSARIIDTAPFPKIIGKDIHSHFKDLDATNTKIRGFSPFILCPFCGLETLKMIESEGRPHYDHILPKGSLLYVFSAVNLKNLVPIGSTCNSLKDTANLLYSDQQQTVRSIAFYPYDNLSEDPFSVISITLHCNREPNFRQSGKWSVIITSQDRNDINLENKIATWNRVFNIQNRYAEFLNRDYTWINNIILGLTSMDDAKRKLQDSYSDIKLTCSFVAIENGIMLRKALIKWILESSDFLPGFFKDKQQNYNRNLNVSLSDCI